jgi:hypothetical protein
MQYKALVGRQLHEPLDERLVLHLAVLQAVDEQRCVGAPIRVLLNRDADRRTHLPRDVGGDRQAPLEAAVTKVRRLREERATLLFHLASLDLDLFELLPS